MSNKPKVRKHRASNGKRASRSPKVISAAALRIQYRFWILIGVLILAGIAMVMHIEAPVVWSFLYSIGGLAALTTNLGNNPK